jgi:kumamolisin
MKRIPRALPLALCAALAAACSSQGAIPPPAGISTGAAGRPLAPGPASANAASVVATATSLQSLGVTDEGAAPAGTMLSLALTLRYRHRAQLDRLVAQQSNPLSAQYRHWLSNAQFDAEFGPSPQTYAAVLRSLRASGFRIDRTYRNRTVVDASAPIGTIERYFHTTIHRVEQPHYGTAYVNTSSAYAPPALAGMLLGVDGLDTVVIVRTFHATISPGIKPFKGSPGKSSLFGPVSSATGGRGYSPLAFSAGYDLPVMHAGTGGKPYDGTGRASGIVIDADFAESDLRQFLSYFGITRTGPPSTRVLIHGGPPKGDAAADSVEAVLDTEALVGNAPGTALYVYEMPSLKNAYITDVYNSVVAANKVDTVNSSFGGCEADVGMKTVQAWSAIAEQGAAKGMTFHASTGDTGGSLCANAPASSSYFVAVGGTALTVGSGGAWASEIGWSGSGGGVSSVFAQPTWQTGVAGTVDRGRSLPDVALDADPYTGIAFFYTGSWNTQYNPLGGTSLSSPLFGAAITEIDQMKGGRLGLAADALFGALAAHGYASGSTTYFHDIVQGTNGTFYAAPGYDLVTGIGSLDAWNLAGVL